MRILVVGGAVAAGARTYRGWPELLWELTGSEVVNVAETGVRMLDVLRSVPRAPGSSYDVVVVEATVYDARGGGTPPSEFAALVEQTADIVVSRWPEAEVLVLSPTPISRDCSVSGFNRSARRWLRRVLPELQALDAVSVLDVSGLDLSLLPDGLHPSIEGAREIAGLVASQIALLRAHSQV